MVTSRSRSSTAVTAVCSAEVRITIYDNGSCSAARGAAAAECVVSCTSLTWQPSAIGRSRRVSGITAAPQEGSKREQRTSIGGGADAGSGSVRQ
jgi:hypothetical protein